MVCGWKVNNPVISRPIQCSINFEIRCTCSETFLHSTYFCTNRNVSIKCILLISVLFCGWKSLTRLTSIFQRILIIFSHQKKVTCRYHQIWRLVNYHKTYCKNKLHTLGRWITLSKTTFSLMRGMGISPNYFQVESINPISEWKIIWSRYNLVGVWIDLNKTLAKNFLTLCGTCG